MKLPLLLSALAPLAFAAPIEPKFAIQDIDRSLKIGYGIAISDVDGDKLPDILLADAKQFRWYRNPGKRDAQWPSYILAENLTKRDNVCIAAQDIDGDGKCEVAVGAEWNPADTEHSGAVFYLIPPANRTQPWEPVKFPQVEPTTHRMRWVQIAKDEWGLLVLPLHGRGNKNAEGAGVKVLLYRKPADPKAEWKSELLDESLHAAHNFEPATMDPEFSGTGPKLILGGKEGVLHLRRRDGVMQKAWLAKNDGNPHASLGVGEVRGGRFQWGESFVTIEPMHGHTLALYTLGDPGKTLKVHRKILTDQLIQGHALACGDLLGVNSDQIVVGWRGNGPGDDVGISIWTPMDEKGAQWRETRVDRNETACEDLTLGDLDRDGKLDIVAAGRATKNLRIFWNAR